jgi:purine-nucleoside phosphorylase
MNYDELKKAADAVAAATGRVSHDTAVVLGSGLSGYAADLDGAVAVPYDAIPGFPATSVTGHGGTLYSVPVGDGAALFLGGRAHTYEGWDLDDVVFGVRTAALGGCRSALLTNAAGGITERMVPGALVAIRDHLNLAARNPLVGPNDDRLGPRFPDMSTTYSERLRGLVREAFAASDTPYREGVYAWFLGPSYETPAEVRMAEAMGADLVGMSTVPEAIALRHMGVEVAGISLVTNYAAGIADAPLSHDEVTEQATAAMGRFRAVLDGLVPSLVAA